MNANLSNMSLPILIACGYVVIAIIIYLIASFIDGRKMGKGEITQKEAEDETEDNAITAIFWPVAVLFLISLSPFALIGFIGKEVRKIGESTIKLGSYTTLQNDADSDSICNNISDNCTSN